MAQPVCWRHPARPSGDPGTHVRVTDWPFRRVVRMLGGGLVVSEMVASAAILSGVRQEMRKLSTDAAAEYPFSLQLAGWDPAVMAEAARIGADLGAAIIDINMGCPARKVTGKLSGSATCGKSRLSGRFLLRRGRRWIFPSPSNRGSAGMIRIKTPKTGAYGRGRRLCHGCCPWPDALPVL